MSDRLEEIKARFVEHAGMDIAVFKDGQLKVDMKWLIAEVERLCSWNKKLMLGDEDHWNEWTRLQEAEESLTKERDITQKLMDEAVFATHEIKIQKTKLEAENAQLNFTVETGVVAINNMATKLAASQKARLEVEAENALMRTVLTESQSALIVSEMRRL